MQFPDSVIEADELKGIKNNIRRRYSWQKFCKKLKLKL